MVRICAMDAIYSNIWQFFIIAKSEPAIFDIVCGKKKEFFQVLPRVAIAILPLHYVPQRCSNLLQNSSQMVDEDKTSSVPVRQSTIGLTPIQSLFDFSSTHWYSRSSIHSFDEELELYKMLDLDANGKDVNVDEDTGRAVPRTHIWLWPYSLQL